MYCQTQLVVLLNAKLQDHRCFNNVLTDLPVPYGLFVKINQQQKCD